MPYKSCTKGHQNGVRSAKCKTCGEPFVIKSTKIKRFVPSDVEWNTLEKGDEIRIVAGYGPWHESLDIDGNTKRVYIGCDAGAYTVEDYSFLMGFIGILFTWAKLGRE